MARKIFVLMLFSAILSLFISCSNIFGALGLKSESGSGSLAVVLPGTGNDDISDSAGRAMVNINDITLYTLVLSGSSTYTQTGSSGSTVNFKDIDAGSYFLTGTAQNSSGSRLAYGSMNVEVLDGETAIVSLTLNTTPPMSLWSKKISTNTGGEEKTEYTVYIADTVSYSSTVKSISGLSSNYTEFDGNRNLYAAGTDGCMYVYGAPDYTELITSWKSDSSAAKLTGIYYAEDGLIYFIDYNKNLYIYNASLYGGINMSGNTVQNPGMGEYGAAGCFAVTQFSDGAACLYTAANTSENPEIINITGYTLGVGSDGVYSVNATSKTSFSYTLRISSGVPAISDIYIHNGYLYVLFNCNTDYTNATLYSYGGLIRFVINSGYSLGEGECFGIDFANHSISLRGSGYWPVSSTSGFYGPKKILTARSRYLYIADDGMIYENGSFIQKDRIIRFDTAAGTLSSLAVNNDVIFDGNYAGVEDSPPASSYALCDTGPAGGIIFYINGNAATDGWTYLEAAPADLSGTYAWDSSARQLDGLGTAIGTGLANTELMVAESGGYEAARACSDYVLNGYSDWFWASSLENVEIRNTIGSSTSGAVYKFQTSPYFCSSQSTDGTLACYTWMISGDINKSDGSKKELQYIRPIRRF